MQKEALTFAKFESPCQLVNVGKSYIWNFTTICGSGHKSCRFRAYLSDGPTNAGIREHEIVCCGNVREGNTTAKLLGIQHLVHAHGDNTLAPIEKVVSKYLDSAKMMYQKGVNCNCDSTCYVWLSRRCTYKKKREKKACYVIHPLHHIWNWSSLIVKISNKSWKPSVSTIHHVPLLLLFAKET